MTNTTNEKTATVQLLPKGAFVITKTDGSTLPGKFSLNILEEYCQAKQIDNHLKFVEKIVVGMTMGEYAELVCLAVKPASFTKNEMLDFIDEQFDGLSNEFLKLVVHAIGRLGKAKATINGEAVSTPTAEEQAAEELKKKEQKESLNSTDSEPEPILLA